MAGRGPAPKPAHLRQRTNKKHGAAMLPEAPESVGEPELPAGRVWREATVRWWGKVWTSPMATQYLPTDFEGLARLAVLVDLYDAEPSTQLMSEIRLQEARFGLSPLDRSRLAWEIARGDEAAKKAAPRPEPRKPAVDPRKVLQMVVS